MMVCKRCQDGLWSHGEQFRTIKYYDGRWADHEPDEVIKCEWCGEEYTYYDDEVDEIEFL